jgi:hypothetical protein
MNARAEGGVVPSPGEASKEGHASTSLSRTNTNGLFKAPYFVTGNRHDAEELMQDAFLRVWERWDQMGRIDDPTGYIFRVALNGFRMRRRCATMAIRKAVLSSGPRRGRRMPELEEVFRVSTQNVRPKPRALGVLNGQPRGFGRYVLDGGTVTFVNDAGASGCVEGDDWTWAARLLEDGRLRTAVTEDGFDICRLGVGEVFTWVRLPG